jgi:hypothetical protein
MKRSTPEYASVQSGLQGGRPGAHQLEVYCSDETDGFLGSEWGADDIKVELTTDYSVYQRISADELGGFDEGDPAELVNTPLQRAY